MVPVEVLEIYVYCICSLPEVYLNYDDVIL